MSDHGESYEVNGSDYEEVKYAAGDFKRRNSSAYNQDNRNTGGKHEQKDQNAPKVQEYIQGLLIEKQNIDASKFPNAYKLLDQELTKTQTSGLVPTRDIKFADVYRERPIRVVVKVAVPLNEHPKFNFVGKILGPKGHTIARLQEETLCKMSILGRGSMRDRNKEEELRKACDPKFAHLTDDLHLEISAFGPPAEAHARVAFALAEIRKYLIPDNNDMIRQVQMHELEMLGSRQEAAYPLEYAPSPRGVVSTPHISVPPVPMRTATRTPVVHPRDVMSPKTKILSILDRARVAMEETYISGYEPTYEPLHPIEPVAYHHPAHYSIPPAAAPTPHRTATVRYASTAYAPPPSSALSYGSSTPIIAEEYTPASSSSTGWKTSSYSKTSGAPNVRVAPAPTKYRSSPYTRQ